MERDDGQICVNDDQVNGKIISGTYPHDQVKRRECSTIRSGDFLGKIARAEHRTLTPIFFVRSSEPGGGHREEETWQKAEREGE
jgi:hypothetical protein